MGGIGRNAQIYRVFPRDYFFALFESRRNALVLPQKWEDPFENVILKSAVVTAAGRAESFTFHENVYGQCWTRETASDAIWQIYSRKKDAIRVRTTVGRLIDSLCAAHGDGARDACFIGNVEYLRDGELNALGRTIFKRGITPAAIAHSVLLKRRAYKHENEVRLVYVERGGVKHPNGVFKYAIDPLALIDQAMVDGRVSYSDFLPLKKKIIKRTGLSARRVQRSLLYRLPKDFIVEIP